MSDYQQNGTGSVPGGRSAAYFAQLSVSDLARECAEETRKFLSGGKHDERAGLELFRRAIGGGDEYAWACLYRQYAPLVLTWVNQHQSAASIFSQEGPDPLVNAAFAKFAQAVTPAKLEGFTALATLLKYLKLCVHSVILDEVRLRKAQAREEALEIEEHDSAVPDPAEGVVAELGGQRLWQLIAQELSGEEEQALLYCAYVLGLKPAEIARLQPSLFASVEDVYRVKRNVLERLRRNRQLLASIRRVYGADE